MFVVLAWVVAEQEVLAVGIVEQAVVAEALSIQSLVALDRVVKTPFFVESVMLTADT